MSKFYRVILIIAGICFILGFAVCSFAVATGGWDLVRNRYDRFDMTPRENYSKTLTDPIRSLDFQMEYGKVILEKGDTFSIEAEDVPKDSIKTNEVVNGTWRIRQRRYSYVRPFHWLNLDFVDDGPTITITVPQDFKAEQLEMDTGLGDVSISDMETDRAVLNLGAGRFTADSFRANDTKIGGGVGEVRFRDAELHDLDFDAGVGSFSIDGSITGRSKISGGVGEISLDLEGNQDDYYLDLDTGVGEVSLNGDTIRSSVGKKDAPNELKIDGGVGEIHINIEE